MSEMQVQLKRHPRRNWLFEFSFNGKKWYSVHDRNVVRVPPYTPLRMKLDRVLQGAVETFDGHYCRETKTLAITAEEV